MKPKKKYKPKLNSQIRSALRRLWSWSDERKEALNNARITRGVYTCAICKQAYMRKDVQVDHIEECGTCDTGHYDEFIARLFCPPEQLRILCTDCHTEVTNEQKARRAEERKKKKQQAHDVAHDEAHDNE